MILEVDDDIKLALTNQEFAVELYKVIDSNRPHLSQFLPWVDAMRSVEDLRSYLEYCEQLYAEKKEVSFIILFQDNPVGRIGLHHLNLANKIAAIGYWLDKDVVGKGIISKSCTRLIDYGFRELELNRIEIKAAGKNTRSQAIPGKLNFTKEGILRQAEFVNGEFVDLFLFSLLKEEWKTRNTTPQ